MILAGIAFRAALLCAMAGAAGAQSLPRFEDHPVSEIYRGRTAAVRISRRDPFRTRIRWAARNVRPNFAGHYILSAWGCGTECLMGVIIDAKSGRVYDIPFTICCMSQAFGSDTRFEPIEFDLRSRLIIFRGARNEEGMGTYYYRWDGRRLVLIRAVEAPARSGASPSGRRENHSPSTLDS